MGVQVSNNCDVGLAPYILMQFGIEIPSSKPAMLVTHIFGEKNPQLLHIRIQSVEKLLHCLAPEIMQSILESISPEIIM